MLELKGKKVLVVGLGKSGRAAALFLRHQGAQVTVSDVRSAEALAKDIPALLEEGIMVEAGGHGLLTFRRQDLIVVSPGVPLDTPELAQARNLNHPIIGELELAARFLKGHILAITGSNGKTTTTALAGEILKTAGMRALVGGNIGVPVVSLIQESTDASWAVLEVSSFQLESTEEFRPAIAVILNITPDHLDRHGNFENYARAKERIFARQQPGDALVLNADNARTAEAASRAPSSVYWFSIEHRVRQGAWVQDGYVVFRSAPDAETEQVMPPERHPAQGRAQRGKRAGRRVRDPPRRSARRSDSQCNRKVPGRGASPGICGNAARRGVLQRLEGHQRGRNRQGNCRIFRRRPSHPRRQRQGFGLHDAFARCCASACAPSTPSARPRRRSSRNCAG